MKQNAWSLRPRSLLIRRNRLEGLSPAGSGAVDMTTHSQHISIYLTDISFNHLYIEPIYGVEIRDRVLIDRSRGLLSSLPSAMFIFALPLLAAAVRPSALQHDTFWRSRRAVRLLREGFEPADVEEMRSTCTSHHIRELRYSYT